MLAAPADALPRQIYADWLDEHGDPDAGCLRGDRGFMLAYLVAEGGQWQVRNRRRVDWSLAAAEIRALAAQGIVGLPDAVRDFNCLCVTCSDRPRPYGSRRAEGNQRRLEVRLASGEPAPSFVNYLLYRTAGLSV
jgi:uncharacterized protein (TIGR02996 family)